MNNELLKIEVKRAYELTRFRESLILLAWTIPLTLISFWACGTPLVSFLLGISLSVLSVILLWRGQLFGKAALQGLALGSVAFFIPLIFHVTGLCCAADIEKEVCVVTGSVLGVILAKLISKIEGNKTSYTVSSLGVIILAGVLGCSSMGLGAILGLIIGILAPLLPAYKFFRK